MVATTISRRCPRSSGDRASVSGTEGRTFDSCRGHKKMHRFYAVHFCLPAESRSASPSIQNTYLATEFPAFGFPTSNDAVEKAPVAGVETIAHRHAQGTSSIERRIPLSYWSVRPGYDEVEAYPLPQLFRAVFFLAGFPPHGRAWSRVGIAYAGEESCQHIDVLVINIVKDDPTNAFNMIGSSSL